MLNKPLLTESSTIPRHFMIHWLLSLNNLDCLPHKTLRTSSYYRNINRSKCTDINLSAPPLINQHLGPIRFEDATSLWAILLWQFSLFEKSYHLACSIALCRNILNRNPCSMMWCVSCHQFLTNIQHYQRKKNMRSTSTWSRWTGILFILLTFIHKANSASHHGFTRVLNRLALLCRYSAAICDFSYSLIVCWTGFHHVCVSEQ